MSDNFQFLISNFQRGSKLGFLSLLLITHFSLLIGGAPVAFASIGASSNPVASTSPAYAANQTNSLNQGLVGYWTMDQKDINWANNTMVDRSGNGNTGAMGRLGKATSTIAGKIGQAMNFAPGSEITKTPMTSLNPSTAPVTVSLWLLPRPNCQSGEATRCGVFSTNWDYELYYGPSGFSAFYEIPQMGCTLAGGTLTRNKWNHLVIIYRPGNQAESYLNGRFVSQVTCGGVFQDFNQFSLGYSLNGAGLQQLNGAIDDVRIYNRALSAAEIRQLYNQTASSKISASPTVVASTSPSYIANQTNSLNQGLVGYWTMDQKDINWTNNTMVDRSGNGNTGTLSGMTKAGSPTLGKVGQAMKFNGSNGCVGVGSNSILSLRNNITVSAWLKSSNLSGDHEIFSSNTASDGFGLRTSGTGLVFTTRNVKDYSSTLVTLSPNVWTHVIAVMDSSNNVTFYINGLNKQTINGTTQGNIGTGYSVGCRYDVGRYFGGSLDDVRIYNRALSATEIRQLYNQTASSKISASPTVIASTSPSYVANQTNSLNQGLVGYWTMDQKDINWTNNTMVDRSGNGNTGTMVGLGKATSTTQGKVGQGMLFDGRAGRSINVTQKTGFSGTTGSIGLWFYKKASLLHLVGYRMGMSNQIRIDDNQLVTFDSSTQNRSINFTSKVPLLNHWYHLVVTWDNGNLKVFIDGRDTGVLPSGAGTGIWNFQLADAFMIGRGNISNHNGSLDDVRIYNRALSATEVRQLYNQGR